MFQDAGAVPSLPGTARTLIGFVGTTIAIKDLTREYVTSSFFNRPFLISHPVLSCQGQVKQLLQS